jgi:hypothetical protein
VFGRKEGSSARLLLAAILSWVGWYAGRCGLMLICVQALHPTHFLLLGEIVVSSDKVRSLTRFFVAGDQVAFIQFLRAVCSKILISVLARNESGHKTKPIGTRLVGACLTSTVADTRIISRRFPIRVGWENKRSL